MNPHREHLHSENRAELVTGPAGILNRCHFGDCREVMKWLDEQGVKARTCVTSPPYWGLRDYGTASWEGGDPACSHRVGNQVQDGKAPGAIVSGVRPGADVSRCLDCGARRVDQQLGLEKTPDEYVANMVEVFRGVRDLLTDDGTLWLNLGDSYANDGKWGGETGGKQHYLGPENRRRVGREKRLTGLKAKDLIGIPWRVAFALQADGWYLRSEITWCKKAPMPESVSDRPTSATEKIFLLTKSESYYYDADAVRNPPSESFLEQIATGYNGHATKLFGEAMAQDPSRVKNRTIDAARKRVDKQRGHSRRHAGFNDRWDNMTREEQMACGSNMRNYWVVGPEPYPEAHFATFPTEIPRRCILAGSQAGDIVLDPFLGSGTTAEVAQSLGRQWVGCELNPEYRKLQDRRTAQQGLVL